MGGRGFADVDNGTTTTVPLALFSALTVRITAGRHFWISIPSDGSKLTHHISPRRIGTPSGFFLTANAVSDQPFTPLAHFRVQHGVPLNLKGKKVQKYQYLGLWLFVAIPLPGTGAWTGSLAAAFLGMRLKKAMPAVVLGVLTAGCIMLGLTHVGVNLFSGAI